MTRHSSTVIPANIGIFRSPAGVFRPTGRLRIHGRPPAKHNPYTWRPEGKRKSLAARLFVGLSVNDKPTWKVKDIERIVGRVRRTQSGDPSASFVAQRGIFQHAKGSIVDEDSVQVIVIDTRGTPRKKFRKEMLRLAEILAAELRQESVIVEIQKNGITKDMFGVRARKSEMGERAIEP